MMLAYLFTWFNSNQFNPYAIIFYDQNGKSWEPQILVQCMCTLTLNCWSWSMPTSYRGPEVDQALETTLCSQTDKHATHRNQLTTDSHTQTLLSRIHRYNGRWWLVLRSKGKVPWLRVHLANVEEEWGVTCGKQRRNACPILMDSFECFCGLQHDWLTGLKKCHNLFVFVNY